MKFRSVRLARMNVAKTFTLAVAASVVASGISLSAAAAAPARADAAPVSASDQEWTGVQGQLSGIEGTWTDQTYPNALTTGMPDTALLGNGDVGVVSGGGTGYKSFYVTKGDFWSGNGGVSPAGLGSVSIKPVTPPATGPVDLAQSATATASNYYQSFTPDRAVNGQWGAGYEGWVTNVGKPQWLALDLGSVKDISRYVIKFDSAARPGNDPNTGKDFILQTSVDGTSWTNLDTTTGNTAALFDKTLPTFSTRYIRLYLNTPTQESTSDSTNNPRARIGAFELYGSSAPVTPLPPATKFLEKENILDAQVDTDVNIGSADLSMHTWVAANDNIVVTQLTSDAAQPVDLQLQTWAGAGAAKAGTVSTAGVDGSTLWATRSTSPNGSGWVSRAALATRLLGAALSNTGATGPTASGQFTLQPGQTVQIVTGVGGGGQNTTGHLEQAEALVSDIDTANVESLYGEHAAWWKKFWLQSHVSLGDPTLEKYYYSALYFMGSASRAGKQAPGIFGIWATQDNQQWSGDYHLNYNAQAPFYGVYSANRPELALPFYDTILDYVPEAQRRAQNDLARLFPSNIGIASRPDLSNGIEDGVLFPVGIGPWGSTTDNNYHHQTLDSLFNATQFISYYDYTGDTDYLANEAYPYLVKTANFFEQYLQFDSSTNLYYMYSAHHEGTWAKDSSPDIGMLKYLLSSLIDESTTLGVDADKRDTWQHILDHLPAAPTTTYNGKTVYALAEPGTTTVPPDDGAGTDTRDIRPGDQPVNLEFVAPGNQIGINSPADQRQIVIDTLTAMNSWGQDNAFPKVFTIAARVGWPAQDLINRLDQQITNHMGPNMRIVSPQHGIEKNGAIEAIDSMLLQTSEGITDVFPDWPIAKDASFTRLRTEGAFTLSAALTNSTVGPISATSDKGNTLKLKNPWPTSNISVTKGGHAVDYELASGVITFDTTAGADYVVSLVAAPSAVSAPTISGTATVGESLTAAAGDWNVGGLDFGYQWHRNGVDIDGATDSTYALQAADYGAILTVTVTASRDGFGSGSASSDPAGPVRETNPPTVQVAVSPDASPSGWRTAPTSVTVTAADDISGVASIEYRIGDGDWQPYSGPSAVADGTTEIEARATDVAGNVSEPVATTAKVDTVAPVSTASVDETHRTVALTATDVTSGVDRIEYNSGAGWSAYSTAVVVGPKATTVEYRSVDVAGNIETARSLVVPAAPTPLKTPTVDATAQRTTSTYGLDNSVSVRVSGSAAVPSGGVTVSADGTVLGHATLNGQGKATIPIDGKALTPGAHQLVVTYAGNTVYAAATDSVSITVTKATTATVALPGKLIYGSSEAPKVTVTVVSTATPDGTISIRDGSRTLVSGVTLVKGKATVTLPKLSRGAYVLTAVYSGSATTSSSSFPLVVFLVI